MSGMGKVALLLEVYRQICQDFIDAHFTFRWWSPVWGFALSAISELDWSVPSSGVLFYSRLSSIRVSGNARAVGFSHLGRANVCGAFLLRILNHIFFRFLVEQPIILSFPWDIWEIPALVLSFSLAQIIYYLCFPTAIKVMFSLRCYIIIVSFSSSKQICTPAGLNLSLLSTNFYSLGAATLVFKYKVWITKPVYGLQLFPGSSTCFTWSGQMHSCWLAT